MNESQRQRSRIRTVLRDGVELQAARHLFGTKCAYTAFRLRTLYRSAEDFGLSAVAF